MIEREWREASDMRRSTVSLVAILAVAAALRFAGLGSGIPYAIGVDEPQVINRAVVMMKTGDFNPHFFDYPALYIYVQLVTAVARFLAGATAGTWSSLDQATMTDFLLWGRAVTAALGTATVLLVYSIGLRWGTRPALLASALMAVLPLHVRESHYVLTDVPLTFFVTLTLLLTLRAHEHPRARAYGWAGAAAGLAAATKYPGALALLLPLLAAWMTPTAPSRAAAALLATAAAAGSFLLAAPYTVLDLPAFLNGYARLAAVYSPRASDEPGWIIYGKHLRNSVHWPALLLMLCGAALAAYRSVRGPGRVRWTLALVFPSVYFLFLSRQSGLIYGRYLLPVLPFASLLAATAVVSGVGLLRRFSIPRSLRTALIAALTVATLLPAAATSVTFNRTIARRGTAALAYDWLVRHVPRDSTVVMEAAGLTLPEGAFKVQIVRHLPQHDAAYYVDTGVDYLIASSQIYGRSLGEPHRFPAEYAAYMRIFEQNEEVARFAPSAEHPGAEFRIFKVRR